MSGFEPRPEEPAATSPKLPSKQEWISLGFGLLLAIGLTLGQALVTLEADVDLKVFASTTAVALARSVGQYVVTRIGQRAIA